MKRSKILQREVTRQIMMRRKTRRRKNGEG